MDVRALVVTDDLRAFCRLGNRRASDGMQEQIPDITLQLLTCVPRRADGKPQTAAIGNGRHTVLVFTNRACFISRTGAERPFIAVAVIGADGE